MIKWQYPISTKSEMENLNDLQNKKLFLRFDREISEHLMESIEQTRYVGGYLMALSGMIKDCCQY